MKSILLGLVLGILLASGPRAYTQREPERIYVGTTSLQLGMEEHTVISKLAELGYTLNKTPGSERAVEGWIVTGNLQISPFGSRRCSLSSWH